MSNRSSGKASFAFSSREGPRSIVSAQSIKDGGTVGQKNAMMERKEETGSKTNGGMQGWKDFEKWAARWKDLMELITKEICLSTKIKSGQFQFMSNRSSDKAGFAFSSREGPRSIVSAQSIKDGGRRKKVCVINRKRHIETSGDKVGHLELSQLSKKPEARAVGRHIWVTMNYAASRTLMSNIRKAEMAKSLVFGKTLGYTTHVVIETTATSNYVARDQRGVWSDWRRDTCDLNDGWLENQFLTMSTCRQEEHVNRDCLSGLHVLVRLVGLERWRLELGFEPLPLATQLKDHSATEGQLAQSVEQMPSSHGVPRLSFDKAAFFFFSLVGSGRPARLRAKTFNEPVVKFIKDSLTIWEPSNGENPINNIAFSLLFFVRELRNKNCSNKAAGDEEWRPGLSLSILVPDRLSTRTAPTQCAGNPSSAGGTALHSNWMQINSRSIYSHFATFDRHTSPGLPNMEASLALRMSQLPNRKQVRWFDPALIPKRFALTHKGLTGQDPNPSRIEPNQVSAVNRCPLPVSVEDMRTGPSLRQTNFRPTRDPNGLIPGSGRGISSRPPETDLRSRLSQLMEGRGR
ncbi:hypothetical protein EGW08_005967 [Elysia chlorotica]|uniref:Uncharacterized protein n=1 Tax=Elysia chlorotica TaxID=188477 RepID=A0A3S1C920_ELYCH|nr:hypothetical protein EGW08_005967 [Elysia chlorotica]